MNLTPWFNLNQIPVRPGIYQRKSPFMDSVVYAHWTGSQWMMFGVDEKKATWLAEENLASAYQQLPWRGLAVKP